SSTLPPARATPPASAASPARRFSSPTSPPSRTSLGIVHFVHCVEAWKSLEPLLHEARGECPLGVDTERTHQLERVESGCESWCHRARQTDKTISASTRSPAWGLVEVEQAGDRQAAGTLDLENAQLECPAAGGREAAQAAAGGQHPVAGDDQGPGVAAQRLPDRPRGAPV